MSLHGKTILITRAAAQAGGLRDQLSSRGARVVDCATIEILPPDDWAPVDAAIANLNSYDWILFTSANAVEQFMNRAHALKGVRVAAIGAATARKLEDSGVTVDLLPRDFHAEGMLDAFPAELDGRRILIPRAEKAREILPDELRRRGAVVDVVTVYRTVPAANRADVTAALQNQKIDCVVFTSGSTIHYLAEALDGDLSLLKGAAIAVIGPITRSAAERFGLRPSIEPETASISSLVEAIDRAMQERG